MIIELPPQARIAIFPSPTFDTVPPTLRHGDRIPADIRAAMAPAWQHGPFAARTITVYRIPDVTIVQHGLVFDADQRLFRGSITQHGDAEMRAARGELAGAPHVPGTAVLCKKPGAGNYGHWMLEMLPRAFVVHHLMGLRDVRYLVHAAEEPLRQVMLDGFDLLGIPPDAVIFSAPAPLHFASLILVDGLADHGGYLSPVTLAAIDVLSKSIAPENAAPVYVSRRGRSFHNDRTVEAVARAEGWRVVAPETLALREQIAVFKHAPAIAGVMGAGLTNIAFAAPGTRVTCFAPANMPDVFFWFIANLRGLPYEEVRCMLHDDRVLGMPYDRSIALPMAEILKVFER